MAITNYQDLEIWKLAMDLCEIIYKMTNNFPKNETYGLSAQLRRAAVSVPSNIAEGFVRRHRKELRQFIAMSIGSLAEINTQITLAKRLNYLGDEETRRILDAIDLLGRKMTRFFQGIKLD